MRPLALASPASPDRGIWCVVQGGPLGAKGRRVVSGSNWCLVQRLTFLTFPPLVPSYVLSLSNCSMAVNISTLQSQLQSSLVTQSSMAASISTLQNPTGECRWCTCTAHHVVLRCVASLGESITSGPVCVDSADKS